MEDRSLSAWLDNNVCLVKAPTVYLCDLPKLRSFTVGNFCLFPIAFMELMSCYGILFLHIDINDHVVCQIGEESFYVVSLESTSSI